MENGPVQLGAVAERQRPLFFLIAQKAPHHKRGAVRLKRGWPEEMKKAAALPGSRLRRAVPLAVPGEHFLLGEIHRRAGTGLDIDGPAAGDLAAVVHPAAPDLVAE